MLAAYIWFCGKAGRVDYPPPILLNGLPLPWVETATHLGHELHQKCTMDYDAKCKRGAFIEKTTNIRETFSFARPSEQMAAISTYASGLYRFALWGLYGERAQSAFKCWGTAAKLCWGAPALHPPVAGGPPAVLRPPQRQGAAHGHVRRLLRQAEEVCGEGDQDDDGVLPDGHADQHCQEHPQNM